MRGDGAAEGAEVKVIHIASNAVLDVAAVVLLGS
jgi:hypothetical protein